MKVFDFSKGRKGALLADITKMSASSGWLVCFNSKVYKVDFTVDGRPSTAGTNWQWTSGASYPEWVNDKRTGKSISIRPEDFGVEAVCFCSGKTSHDNKWNWYAIGTNAWNKWACEKRILRATYSHDYDPTPIADDEAA